RLQDRVQDPKHRGGFDQGQNRVVKGHSAQHQPGDTENDRVGSPGDENPPDHAGRSYKQGFGTETSESLGRAGTSRGSVRACRMTCGRASSSQETLAEAARALARA